MTENITPKVKVLEKGIYRVRQIGRGEYEDYRNKPDSAPEGYRFKSIFDSKTNKDFYYLFKEVKKPVFAQPEAVVAAVESTIQPELSVQPETSSVAPIKEPVYKPAGVFGRLTAWTSWQKNLLAQNFESVGDSAKENVKKLGKTLAKPIENLANLNYLNLAKVSVRTATLSLAVTGVISAGVYGYDKVGNPLNSLIGKLPGSNGLQVNLSGVLGAQAAEAAPLATVTVPSDQVDGSTLADPNVQVQTEDGTTLDKTPATTTNAEWDSSYIKGPNDPDLSNPEAELEFMKNNPVARQSLKDTIAQNLGPGVFESFNLDSIIDNLTADDIKCSNVEYVKLSDCDGLSHPTTVAMQNMVNGKPAFLPANLSENGYSILDNYFDVQVNVDGKTVTETIRVKCGNQVKIITVKKFIPNTATPTPTSLLTSTPQATLTPAPTPCVPVAQQQQQPGQQEEQLGGCGIALQQQQQETVGPTSTPTPSETPASTETPVNTATVPAPTETNTPAPTSTPTAFIPTSTPTETVPTATAPASETTGTPTIVATGTSQPRTATPTPKPTFNVTQPSPTVFHPAATAQAPTATPPSSETLGTPTRLAESTSQPTKQPTPKPTFNVTQPSPTVFHPAVVATAAHVVTISAQPTAASAEKSASSQVLVSSSKPVAVATAVSA